MDIKGIWNDPGTTIAGIIVLIITIGLVIGTVNMQTWAGVTGAVAGMRWLLEKKKVEHKDDDS